MWLTPILVGFSRDYFSDCHWSSFSSFSSIGSAERPLSQSSSRTGIRKQPNLSRIRNFLNYWKNTNKQKITTIEPQHQISNNVVCATSKASDQPAHTRSLVRAFASRSNIILVLSFWLNLFGVSKLERRLNMLVWVYTCQNATLLEIECRGSDIYLKNEPVHYNLVLIASESSEVLVSGKYVQTHKSSHVQRWIQIKVQTKLRAFCPAGYASVGYFIRRIREYAISTNIWCVCPYIHG